MAILLEEGSTRLEGELEWERKSLDLQLFGELANILAAYDGAQKQKSAPEFSLTGRFDLCVL